MHMRMLHAHKIGEIAFAAGDTFLASESVGAMLLEQGHAVRIDVPEAPAAPTGGEASPPVPAEPVEQEKLAEQPAEVPTAPVEPKTHRGKPKPTGGEDV
jgi:outer membrane biosynthesis protein TonB